MLLYIVLYFLYNIYLEWFLIKDLVEVFLFVKDLEF